MKALLLTFFCFPVSTWCFPQAGFLDESFGNNGKVHTDVLADNPSAALQSDGKILLAGHSAIYHGMVIRYLSDGNVDSAFGKNGIVSVTALTSVGDIKVLQDNYILIAGAVNPNVAVAKLKPNGDIDSSFGKNGVAIVDLGKPALCYAMQVQSDGKILLAGSIQVDEFFGNNMLLARVNSDGSRDKKFGDNGTVLNKSGYTFTCLALQQDRKIVAVVISTLKEQERTIGF